MHFLGTNIKIKFENCVWESNYITQNEGGGAVNIRDGATPSFTSCIFKNNYADHSDNSQGNGGAINIQWANNSNELNDAIIFKKTQFINNFAKSKRSSYGGAVATQRSTTFENCLFINNKAITTNDQGYNWYSVYGGALYSNASLNNTGGTLKVINSTFSGNTVETMINLQM